MSTSTADARPAIGSRPGWRDSAACRDADPDLFFPDAGDRSARAKVKTAKLICRSCPVGVTCLSWALATGQEAGIWGGLTEDERRRLHHRGHGSRPAAYSPRPAAYSPSEESHDQSPGRTDRPAWAVRGMASR